MGKFKLIFPILFLLFLSVGCSVAVPYVILDNGTADDVYMYIESPGYYIIQSGDDSQNGSEVFEWMYENDWNTTVNYTRASIFPRNDTWLNLPMSNGVNQAVHPSVIKFDVPWHGYEYWMGVTGYVNTLATDENPHLFASHDGINWITPDGVSNPVDPYPGEGNYSSDPNIVYDDTTDSIFLYYRTYYAINETQVHYLRTYDGTTMSDATPIMSEYQGGDEDASVSWSVIKHNNIFYAFQIYLDKLYYATSADGKNYGERVLIGEDFPIAIKHADVKYIPELDKWIAMIHSRSDSYYIATSNAPDSGWKCYTTEVMRPNHALTWGKSLYKGSFLYNNTTGLLEIWYTGIVTLTTPRSSYVAYTTYPYEKLFDYLENPTFAALKNDLNLTVSNGTVNISSNNSDGYITTRLDNLQNATLIARGSMIGNDCILGIQPNISTEYRGYIRKRPATNVNFYSAIGSNAVYSTILADTNLHTFVVRLGLTSVDGKSWVNPAVPANVSRAIYLQNITNLDYLAVTKRNINPVNVSNDIFYSDGGIAKISSVNYHTTDTLEVRQYINFAPNIMSGNAPLSVHFKDTSATSQASYYWDFENDGVIDSTKQNPVHTYGQAGTYTVNLTVQNEYGNFSTVKTDCITVSAPAFASDPVAWFNWVFSYLFGRF